MNLTKISIAAVATLITFLMLAGVRTGFHAFSIAANPPAATAQAHTAS